MQCHPTPANARCVRFSIPSLAPCADAMPAGYAQFQYDWLVGEVGCWNASAVVDCLKGKSWAQIDNASWAAAPVWFAQQWAPVVDGVNLQDEPYFALATQPASLPILMGHNTDELMPTVPAPGQTLRTCCDNNVPHDIGARGFAGYANGSFWSQWVIGAPHDVRRSAAAITSYGDVERERGGWWAARRLMNGVQACRAFPCAHVPLFQLIGLPGHKQRLASHARELY